MTEQQIKIAINLVSIAVPIVVAVLLGLRTRYDIGDWTANLPHVIGAVNSVASLSLIAAFWFVKRGRIEAHRIMMLASLALGVVFLICYILYHLTNEPRRFEGSALLTGVYRFILFSHIALSVVVLPLVLRAAGFALTGQFERHRRIAKYAFPIWLYVSVTGVLVYVFSNHLNPSG